MLPLLAMQLLNLMIMTTCLLDVSAISISRLGRNQNANVEYIDENGDRVTHYDCLRAGTNANPVAFIDEEDGKRFATYECSICCHENSYEEALYACRRCGQDAFYPEGHNVPHGGQSYHTPMGVTVIPNGPTAFSKPIRGAPCRSCGRCEYSANGQCNTCLSPSEKWEKEYMKAFCKQRQSCLRLSSNVDGKTNSDANGRKLRIVSPRGNVYLPRGETMREPQAAGPDSDSD